MNTLKLIEGQLQCPFTHQPLYEAVTLTPCAHKVQEAVARISYDLVKNARTHPNLEARCCLCNGVVTGYMADPTIRELVKTVFGPPKDELKSAFERAESDIEPYPGASASFVRKHGNWELFDSKFDLCRKLEFISSTEGSLLKGFTLLGYKNGSVAIIPTLSNEGVLAIRYFNQFGLFLDWTDLRYGIKSKSPEQLRMMFNIIATNNEIPSSHFQMIRDIVDAGSHSTEGFVFT